MTDQHRLERLVRERMASTGEAYTTARRHVLRRRADGAVPGRRTRTAPPTAGPTTRLRGRTTRYAAAASRRS